MMRQAATATDPRHTSPRTTLKLRRSVAMPSCVAISTYRDMADAMSNASVHIPSSRAGERKGSRNTQGLWRHCLTSPKASQIVLRMLARNFRMVLAERRKVCDADCRQNGSQSGNDYPGRQEHEKICQASVLGRSHRSDLPRVPSKRSRSSARL